MAADRLVIGYDPAFTPFSHGEGGAAAGLSVDPLRAMLGRRGIPASFRALDLPALLPALDAGAIDAAAAIALTPERREAYRFLPPLVPTGGAFFATDAYNPSPDEVAIVATPAAGPLAARLRDMFPAMRVLEVGDYREALQAVLDGAARAAALNLHAGAAACERHFPGRLRAPQRAFWEVVLATAALPGSRAAALAQ